MSTLSAARIGPRRGPPPRPQSATPKRAVPEAVAAGTWLALVGVVMTNVLLAGKQPSQLGNFAAIGIGVSIAGSILIDMQRDLRNLIRADILAIAALYFLTFFEFLFPQPDFDLMIGPTATRGAILAISVGLVGLLIGRHLWKPRAQPMHALLTTEVPPSLLIGVFWFCFIVGYLHMLIAVEFDVVEMVRQFMEARFSQSWQRGRLGDWKALLVELGLFIYLIPPLAGIMLARRNKYPTFHLVLISAALAFTVFYGFTSGTRNIFASYLVTFLIGYAFATGNGRRKELVILCTTTAALLVIATFMMVEFRNVGFHNWRTGNYVAPDTRERTLFVDADLYAICKLVEVFPNRRDYLGLEVPYTAIIRPIPRALWPGKPEGLSTSIEDALGVEGLTIAASFVGEAYMAGGLLAVLGTGLLFGALAGWWGHLASPENSELGILIYASGFFAAVITMRSLFVFTTALLPTIAAMVIGSFVVKQIAARRRWPPAPPRRMTAHSAGPQ